MGTFADQIAALAIPETKLVEFQPPRIWWHNGVKQAKTPGNFYTKAAEFPEALVAPWVPDDRFEGEEGYTTHTLRIAVLAVRSQPFKKFKDNDGKDRVEYGTRWEPGMSIHTELLCLIEGSDAPVVWSMKGLTGKAVTGKGGILQTYQSGLLKEASRQAKRGLPLWSFWLPIASKKHGDKIAYEDTGFGSFVTPPALYLPENPIDALFVGGEVLQRGADALNEYASWQDTKRLPEGVVEGEIVEDAPHPADIKQIAAPRNVPQPVSDADFSEF